MAVTAVAPRRIPLVAAPAGAVGRPDHGQGRAGARRRALHLRVRKSGEFPSPGTATAVPKSGECRGRHAGQDQHRRVCHGSSTENSAYGTTRNPWDQRACRGVPAVAARAAVAAGWLGGAGHGYRRQCAPAGFFLRRDWPQAHLWAGFALWAGGLRFFARAVGPLRVSPMRRRSFSDHGRARPAGSQLGSCPYRQIEFMARP